MASATGQPVEDLPDAGGNHYRPYLVRKLKQVKSAGQLNFGFVLGRQAPDHRLAFHQTASGKTLAAHLIKATGLRRATWGVARPDPERPARLQLQLDGRLPVGLCKQGNRMLREFKPLPFVRMVLSQNGQPIEDLPDGPEDALDAPVSLLPEPKEVSTPQSLALAAAAARRAPLCEECLLS
jgi:hypothetical protein